MSQTKEPKITKKQLEKITSLEGDILAHRETVTKCQKTINNDIDSLFVIFDAIKKTTK